MEQQALFTTTDASRIKLAEGAYYLPAFCRGSADVLWQLVAKHLQRYAATQMMTPMGYKMSVNTTSMGALGWVSDARGYGYARINPATQQPWPPIPKTFQQLASRAALAAGYVDFVPDTCLINLYRSGAKMGLHQDKDEADFRQPIISVSLGIAATFLFGGAKRRDPVRKCLVQHGDVVVFGGKSRRYYHGVATIKANEHAQVGALRCNLTFRKAA